MSFFATDAAISEKQSQILDAIRRHYALTGQSPSIREIGQTVGLRSSCSVQRQVETLIRLGKLRRSNYKSRALEVVPDECEIMDLAPATVPIPMMGLVAGGAPMTIAPDAAPELLSLPMALLPRGDGERQAALCAARQFNDAPLFALVVQGDSMRDAGIGNGDFVIARRQATAENGDIVIAMVGPEEATVKRFYRENGAIRLQPENPDFAPLITRDVQVLGRVTLAIKRF